MSLDVQYSNIDMSLAVHNQLKDHICVMTSVNMIKKKAI